MLQKWKVERYISQLKGKAVKTATLFIINTLMVFVGIMLSKYDMKLR
jgi:hypothetical protein